MINPSPVVAHINDRFFAPSMTFVYFYLVSFQRTVPICLSWYSPIENLALFPFPSGDCYGYDTGPETRFTWRRMWNGSRHRLMKAMFPTLLRRPVGRIAWAREILQQRCVSLIHTHFGTTGWQVLPLKRKLRLPLVTTFYGFDVAPSIPSARDWRERRRELFDEGELFLVEGPCMRQRLIDLGCSADRVQIQRIAVDVARMPFRARTSRLAKKSVIIFAGRYAEKKGIMVALEAIRELRATRQDFEFRLIGDGELAPLVRSFIRNNSLDCCVRALGFLDHRAYLSELQRADIFLHPSIEASDGDTEGGAPTAIIEAQALGLPVVSTVHADIPYVTVPDRSALLVPERDSQALCQALMRLLDNPDLWAEMGRQGRAHIERFHDVRKEVCNLEEKYLSLLH